jgi:CBS domain-containing protein
MTAMQRQPEERLLVHFLRRVREATPRTTLGDALALLRIAPHRAVPVVDAGRLVGLFSERCLTRALLAAHDDDGRAALRQGPVSALMEPPGPLAAPDWNLDQFLAACDAHGRDYLPVVEASGRFLGLIARSDLLDELLAVPSLPPIGGMATPLGVYLTSGGATGGVGGVALALTGLLTCLTQALLYLGLGALGGTLREAVHGLWIHWLGVAEPVRQSLGTLLGALGFGVAFLGLLRLSPLAGYHAAEHQVVHAIERGEPLLIESVRLMPREHPRCGTNFIAAAALLSAGGALAPLIGSLGYLVGGVLALGFWRSLGGWLQRHFTTRTATTRQLRSGIDAANELIARQARRGDEPPGGLVRLGRSGMVHILLGYALGGGLLALLVWLIPSLRGGLLPLVQELLF